MAKFTAALAYTTQCYRTVEVEADTIEAAAEILRAAAAKHDPSDFWGGEFKPEDGSEDAHRIVWIGDDDQGITTILDDVELAYENTPWEIISAAELAASIEEMK